MEDFKTFFANSEQWLSNLNAKIGSEDFLLNRDAAIFGLIFATLTKNTLVTIVAWVGGHFIKIDDLKKLFTKMGEPLA